MSEIADEEVNMKTIQYGPLAFLVVLFFATMAFAEAPAPFCAAKQHAMKMAPDADGDYVWEFTKNGDGQEVRYALVYLASKKIILIGRDPIILGYIEDTGEIKAAVIMGLGTMPVEKPREVIIEFAFRVFRELVEAGAL